MNSYNVGVIVGSLRQNSYNKILAQSAIELAPKSLLLHLVEIKNLPLYNQDLDSQLPTPVQEFKSAIEQSDAILIVTPEYNRSIPGVLKNAIDWGSRPEEDNSWSGKAVGIIGASNGRFGTIHAQADVRKVLTHTNCFIMPQPQVLVSNAPKKMTNNQLETKTQQVIQNYLSDFAKWIKQIQQYSSN